MALRAFRDDDGNLIGYRDEDGNMLSPSQVYRDGEGNYRPIPAGNYGSAGMQGDGPGGTVDVNGQQYVQVGSGDWSNNDPALNSQVINHPEYGFIAPVAAVKEAAKYNTENFWDKYAAAIGMGALGGLPMAAHAAGLAAAGSASATTPYVGSLATEALPSIMDAAAGPLQGVMPSMGGTLAQQASLAEMLGTGGLAGSAGMGAGALAEILGTTGAVPGGIPGGIPDSLSMPWDEAMQYDPTGGTQLPAPVEARTPGMGGLDVLNIEGIPSARVAMAPGAASTAVTSAATQLLNRTLGTNLTDADVSIIGKLASGGLGLVGANARDDAFAVLAQKYLDIGAPARARLEASYKDPNSFLDSPDVQSILQRGSDAAARSLSTRYGNPAMAPNAWAELNKQNTGNQWNQLFNYRNQLAAQGQLGVSPASTFDAGRASTAGAGYDIGGALIGDITNPKKTLLQQMNELAALSRGNLFSSTVAS